MFELPEYLTISRQVDETLEGKKIERGLLGNTPHKFVWYNRLSAEFEEQTAGKVVAASYVRRRWLFIPLEPGHVQVLGECGGRVLYHPPETQPLQKYHMLIHFEDGSSLSVMTQMWGAMELYRQGEELDRPYIRSMRPTPVDSLFIRSYFEQPLEELIPLGKRSLKGMLTQDQLIPGLGNAITQDILFRARLHPRQPIQELDAAQRDALYGTILSTVREIAAQGGRYDEYDLFNRPGEYLRLMDKHALRRPCPVRDGEVQKIQYLGGACYFCPRCQV